MSAPDESRRSPSDGFAEPKSADEQDFITLQDVLARLRRGLGQTLGLALLGAGIATVVFLAVSWYLPVSSSTRVFLSFPGMSKGLYPDGSKFESGDLTAPDVVADALKRVGFDVSKDFQSKIRAGLSVTGVMPIDVARERDRAFAAGQAPGPFVPDEYSISLTLKRGFPLSREQRGLLLNAIAVAYREKFERTYVDVPASFGDAFDTLRNSDYFEYEQVLPDELQAISTFLGQQVDQAKDFRSPTTNLSFADLLNQTDIFVQIRLNETLGLIRSHGLTRDRNLALVKMNYYLRSLEDEEQEAMEDEKVVEDLLAKAQARSQSYVLGVKSQAVEQRPQGPLLDQGLIDSLLANDAYNLLVRRALDAGLAVKHIQAKKARLLERKKDMEAFAHQSLADQTAVIAQVNSSLENLKIAYNQLIDRILKTQADFARQQFADAIRLSDETRTEGTLKPAAEVAAAGLLVGAALGMGLSLLGVCIGARDPVPRDAG